jgi:hypothetical protein
MEKIRYITKKDVYWLVQQPRNSVAEELWQRIKKIQKILKEKNGTRRLVRK